MTSRRLSAGRLGQVSRLAGRRLPSWAALATGVAAAAAVMVFGGVLLLWNRSWFEWYFDPIPGEELWHGIEIWSHQMPMKSLLVCLYGLHQPFPWVGTQLLVGVATAATAFMLATAFGSLAAGAAIAAVLLRPMGYMLINPSSFATLLLLSVAAAAAWRADRPSRAMTAWLAALIGSTLLYRSTLFLYGPALAVSDLLRRRRPWRRALPETVILTLGPYLFLLPWVLANVIVSGHFIPFEYKEADSNIVAAALGHVTGIEGNWRLLVESPPDQSRTGAVLVWAAGQVLRHPLRFLLGLFGRLQYVLSLHGALVGFGLLGVYRWRRVRAARAVAFLTGYFIAVHLLLAIHDAYLEPALILLALLSSLSAAPLPKPADAGDRQLRRFATGWGAAVGCAVLGFAFFTCRKIAAVAAADNLGSPYAVREAMARWPRDSWLPTYSADLRLQRGDIAGATADYRRALSLRPDDEMGRLQFALYLLVRGYPQPAFVEQPQRLIPVDRPLNVRFELFRGLALLRQRRSSAAERFRRAWREWMPEYQVGEDLVDRSVEREARARFVQGAPERFIDEMNDELTIMWIDPAERVKTLAAIARANGFTDATGIVSRVAQGGGLKPPRVPPIH